MYTFPFFCIPDYHYLDCIAFWKYLHVPLSSSNHSVHSGIYMHTLSHSSSILQATCPNRMLSSTPINICALSCQPFAYCWLDKDICAPIGICTPKCITLTTWALLIGSTCISLLLHICCTPPPSSDILHTAGWMKTHLTYIGVHSSDHFYTACQIMVYLYMNSGMHMCIPPHSPCHLHC